MSRFLTTCLILAVLVLLAAPFFHEAYRRYEVARNLDSVMDARDRAAFQEWNGDAVSFGRSLLERCELANGRGSPFCQRYRLALE